MLALVMGHQLDFFVGDSQNLRDRVGRSLAAFDPAHPHHGLAAGMHAFGLEECGQYEQAEAVGCYAVEANPDDVWGIHAVTHSYEMRGRVDDGIRFLVRRETDWGEDNFLAVHNWWHLALFLLEAGRPADSLAIYDSRVHNAGSEGVVLNLIDASALLWRLFLDGEDTGDRFGALAVTWEGYTKASPWYAFNDVHAVMALAGAGRTGEARAVIERLERYVAGSVAPGDSNHAMTSAVGLPASRAVLAFAEGRHHDVIADLLPIRTYLARFGGSHAQRDALARTLVESAIATDQGPLARALLRERLSLRESSVYARLREARLALLTGDVATARQAAHEAEVRRRRFAAAYGEAA
jgi:hypothetical protein